MKSLSRVRLCDPVDCSLPGSSIRGILQVRILEWVAISFSRGSSPLRDLTWVPHWQVDYLPLSHQGSPFLMINGTNLLHHVSSLFFSPRHEDTGYLKGQVRNYCLEDTFWEVNSTWTVCIHQATTPSQEGANTWPQGKSGLRPPICWLYVSVNMKREAAKISFLS